MASDETRVTYKAIANFLALKAAAAAARKDLESIRKEEAKTNAASQAGSKKTAQAHRDATKALRSRTTSTKTATAAILAHNVALQDNLKLTRSGGTAAQAAAAKISTATSVIKDATRETKKLADEHINVAKTTKEVAAAEQAVSRSVDRAGNAFQRMAARVFGAKKAHVAFVSEGQKTISTMSRVNNGATNLNNTFRRMASFRPHLIPPFVALVPIIAGLLALMNPLVAALGAVGAAGFGAGSGLLSIGGAAIAIIPMIAAAVGAIAGLLTAFKGIGGVFSKYGQGQRKLAKGGGGGGGGGGGKSAAQQAHDNMKAQERLTNAQENAVKAQNDLNDARKEAVKRLNDLRTAINQGVLDEADAAAQLQLATEAYYNTLADPGSTLGDKMEALASLNDAQQALSDAQKQSVQDAADLADAQAKGVEGDKNVIAAQKDVRDSLREVRDAQFDLNQQVAGGGGGGGGGGGVGAMDAFEQALAALSPSARAVVLALIGMKDAWRAVQRNIQESFFSKIVGDMGALAGFLPTVNNLLSKAAGAMGEFTHNLLMLITSPKWVGDLNIISDQNVRLITLAGDAILYLLDGLKDLVIAAGPFAEDLLKSFSGLMKSFSSIVADARTTGSLASWLDIVYGRIQQWWRIIKNIAGTLFNYGAASAEFGKWITDGLEKSTKNWLDASEKARREGSPFQQWLEDLKPLLREIKGLFGDFFGWLSKTAMDGSKGGAIDEATRIISDIRTKLGPALSDIFDSLNRSGIGKSFVDALSSIVESISSIIKEGGAEGFKSFFWFLSGFFRAVADFVASPAGSWLVATFIPALGVLAGLTFVGQFSGLFLLFGWLLKLGANGGVARLLTGLGGLGGLAGLGGGAAAGAAGGAAGGAAAAGGTVAAAVSSPAAIAAGVASLAAVLKLIADRAVGQAITSSGGSASLAKDARVASTTAQNGSKGSGGVSVGNSILNLGFEKNAKSIDKVTAATKRLQDAAEAQSLSDKSFAKDRDANLTWQQKIVAALEKRAAKEQELKDAVATTSSAQVAALSVLDGAIATNGQHWNDGTAAARANQVAVLNYSIASTAAAEALRKTGGSYAEYKANLDAARQKISDSIVALGGTRGAADAAAAAIVKIPTQKQFTLMNNIDATKAAADGLYNAWNGKTITAKILFAGLDSAAQTINRIAGTNIRFNNEGGYISRALGGIVDHVSHFAAGGKAKGAADSRRGKISNADPRGTDTLPAMLTPGEYVVKKERVDEVGVDKLDAFNSGMLSFSALMSKTKSGKSGGTGFFEAGGLAGTPIGTSAISASAGMQNASQTFNDYSMHFGDIIIQNPAREPASDSLPTAIRKVSYAGGRRKPSPRLEGSNA